MLTKFHATRLEFYSDDSLYSSAILSNMVSSDTLMDLQKLFRLVDTLDGSKVLIRWRGLPLTEDTKDSLLKFL